MNCAAILQKGSLGLVGVVAALRTHLFPVAKKTKQHFELLILSFSKT
jgi:hypothetical protein